MRAGTLDRLVVLQRATETVLPTGAVIETWSTLGEFRASIVNLATADASAPFGEAGATTVLLRSRYYAGLSIADRILLAGDFFDIKSIAEIGRRRGLEIRIERAQ